jgi:hypothetical protein
LVHKTLGQRDPALAFPLARTRDDADERRQAYRAVAISVHDSTRVAISNGNLLALIFD